MSEDKVDDVYPYVEASVSLTARLHYESDRATQGTHAQILRPLGRWSDPAVQSYIFTGYIITLISTHSSNNITHKHTHREYLKD